ncbi:MAG TPA: HD domain-containing phosphohydrolase [Gaiellaceae bacterium]|jgi:ribonuclease P protein subunit RPR2|nr:HD domain-containing phosphohydrolase [Gaiellaceae bacterium]
MRILLVDDDKGLRALLRTTFEAVDVELVEADNAASAIGALERALPDVVVLDVRMPGMDGLELCRRIKADPATRDVAVVLLTGSDGGTQARADEAGANAFVRKPFSPLELLSVVERLAGGMHPFPFRATRAREVEEQLELYARDLRHLLEIERGQRILLQQAYKETVAALASALESKDTGTRAHSQRVQRYAVELAKTLAADLAADPSAEYGFLLHDVGKIGIPDRVLQKPGPLTDEEQVLMRTHTILGEQMLGGVAFLEGPGLEVVRCHHERWDGGGYPDGRAGTDIPLGARIFAVADTLDAMTSDRPYRKAGRWHDAGSEILAQSGRQFDPTVVKAFGDCEPRLRAIRTEFAAA